MPEANDSVLLVTAVAIRTVNGERQIDDQTCEGLKHWCSEFAKVTYVGLVPNPDQADESSVTWRSLEPLINSGRLHVEVLPIGYRVTSHVRHQAAVRKLLGNLIEQHDYLCFALRSLFGDWGALGALEAQSRKRRFALWFDRVEHRVLLATLGSMPWKRQLKTIATVPLMKLYRERLIRRAAVGIFQGRDCYDYYCHNSADPQLVYDTHTKEDHFISDTDLEAKAKRVCAGAPLRIVYAGRAAPMKGPDDWIATLIALKRRGVAFDATWLGDGPSLAAMKAEADRAGLTDAVRFVGHVSDREVLLKTLRDSDLFLFCHKTPESPRCLIETLVSGTPFIGYESAYAAGLLDGREAGRLVKVGDTSSLVETVADLDGDRNKLLAMFRQSAALGRNFDETKIYRERAALLRRRLGPRADAA